MRRLPTFVIAVGTLGSALASCSSHGDPAPSGACVDDAGCDSGLRCWEGACEPLPVDGGCRTDRDCGDFARCVEESCFPPYPPDFACPASPLSEELVCSDWDPSACPCYAGVVSFHEKDEGGRMSCAGVVGIFSQFIYLRQSGCHLAALDDQLTGDGVGFDELRLRIAKLPNDTSCAVERDVWVHEGGTAERPAVKITCSPTCILWMEQLDAPVAERLVPDGTFTMGTPADALPQDRQDEGPAHDVELTCFYVDRFEVSRHDYQQCLELGSCGAPDYAAAGEDEASFFGPGRAALPMVAVTWEQADAFCKFNEKSLPTEAEWERAARSDPAGFEPWPWGAAPPFTPAGRADCERAVFAGCGAGPSPVGNERDGARPGLSAVDAADLAGNVREWTRDLYREDRYERLAARADALAPKNPEELGPVPLGAVRVVRGGSFLSPIDPGVEPPDDALRVSARDHEPEGAALPDLGFRCVRYKPGLAR